jgi:hypothetical protein
MAIQFASAFPGLLQDMYNQLDSKVADGQFKSIRQVRKALKEGISYQAMEIANDEIRMIERDEGVTISFILGYVSLKSPAQKKGKWLEASFGFSVNNFAGTRAELIDYFLLRWNYRRKEYEHTRLAAYPALLQFLTGVDHGDDYEKWRDWNIGRREFASEKEWVTATLKSPSANCRVAALNNLPEHFPEEWADRCIRTALDANEEPDVRWEALEILEEKGAELSGKELTRLLPLLEDDTLVKSRSAEITMMEDHPLSGTALFETAKMILEKTLSEEGEKDDSTLRLNYKSASVLQNATGKKYGLNGKKWRRYLRRR